MTQVLSGKCERVKRSRVEDPHLPALRTRTFGQILTELNPCNFCKNLFGSGKIEGQGMQ